MEVFRLTRGDGPLILTFPHCGTAVPPALRARLNEEGALLRDTDWHVDALYEGLLPEVTMLRAVPSRYVIDLNRDPEGASLYPGQRTTGLIPLTTFDNVPIWRRPPGPEDVAQWREAVHRPWHAAIGAEIERVRARHGFALLCDCHSIRSSIPWLFEGRLPDLNLGSFDGRACAPEVEAAAVRVARGSGFSWVLNGRFRGGWTTRVHGRPQEGVHAFQMELAQASHLALEEPPFTPAPRRFARLRPVLRALLEAMIEAAAGLARAAHPRAHPRHRKGMP